MINPWPVFWNSLCSNAGSILWWNAVNGTISFADSGVVIDERFWRSTIPKAPVSYTLSSAPTSVGTQAMTPRRRLHQLKNAA